MDMDSVGGILQEAVTIALKLGGPVLVLSMLVGVVVAIFQAVTQIHEQTIGFILKLAVVVAVLVIGGGWMLTTLQDFLREIFRFIAS